LQEKQVYTSQEKTKNMDGKHTLSMKYKCVTKKESKEKINKDSQMHDKKVI